ncbi:YtxH domain-containing protein [Pseudanabaena sp. FACHB-2040]|uniref:YtxH domain-containing protein n=1 Tax=Pseudanabaena sp. FACHB-2040 TaxID=2692859 RepID=UPI001689729D|nr:YtxH domain-containing protein [Pseudanabaena sp. FACHB-2040]MBD2257733.1 YtxH domain-containing protein [Pseudanabaena sp. FACHB-2040]
MSGKSGSFLGGVMIGAAIGAVTGLLVAPRTGRETRQILKKSADALPELVEDLSTSVQLQADRLSETALSNWEQTLNRLREAIAAGQVASQREYETLSRQPRSVGVGKSTAE